MPPVLDESTDYAGAFGEGERTTFAGRDWYLRYLDVNDLIYLQRTMFSTEGKSGIEAFDPSNMEHLRLFLYVSLRKSDPALTEAELDAEQYRLTLPATGRLLTLKVLTSDETGELINKIMVGSGLAPDAAETSDPNATKPGRKSR